MKIIIIIGARRPSRLCAPGMRVCKLSASECVRVRARVCVWTRARARKAAAARSGRGSRGHTHISIRARIYILCGMMRRSWRSSGVHTQYSQSHPRGRTGGIYFTPPRRSPVASPLTVTACVCVACVRVRVRGCVCVCACATATSTRTIIETTPPPPFPSPPHGHAPPRRQTGNVYGSSRRYVTELGGGGGGSCVTLSRRRHVSSVTNNYALGDYFCGVQTPTPIDVPRT